ncbi:hypothetical protein CPC08DRAFT_68915 [Agrocybe pediades]|nr:hypothetical protein CPC08DRAFT_68915 [Agrocybe pediades]
MSNNSGNPSKLSGKLQIAKGDVKQGLGTIIGSTKLKLEGQQDRVDGEAEVAAARNGKEDVGPTIGSKTGTSSGTYGTQGTYGSDNQAPYDNHNHTGRDFQTDRYAEEEQE